MRNLFEYNTNEYIHTIYFPAFLIGGVNTIYISTAENETFVIEPCPKSLEHVLRESKTFNDTLLGEEIYFDDWEEVFTDRLIYEIHWNNYNSIVNIKFDTHKSSSFWNLKRYHYYDGLRGFICKHAHHKNVFKRINHKIFYD